MIDGPVPGGPQTPRSLGGNDLAGLGSAIERGLKSPAGVTASANAVPAVQAAPIVVQVTLSALALARLAERPDAALNRNPLLVDQLGAEARQAVDPLGSAVPIQVESTGAQAALGDRPTPYQADGTARSDRSDTPDPARAAAAAGEETPVREEFQAERPSAPSRPDSSRTDWPVSERMTGRPDPAPATDTEAPATAVPDEDRPLPRQRLPILRERPAGARMLTGLVTEGGTSAGSVVLTAKGPVPLATALPAGARVTLAVSDAGAQLLSVVLPPARRSTSGDASRPAEGPAVMKHVPTPADGLPGGQDNAGIAAADHRLCATLLAAARQTVAARETAAAPETAQPPVMLWLGTPELPVPLGIETFLVEEEAAAADRRRRSLRFRFALRLARLGTLQLDGFVRPERFDLRLRSEQPLGPVLEQEVSTIFRQSLELGGIGGSIAFGGAPEPWPQARAMAMPLTA